MWKAKLDSCGKIGMEFKAWFQCINPDCQSRYELTDIVYRCRECDELLEVQHDMGLLKKQSSEEWRDLFDSRYRLNIWPYGSSVWGKRELVCPNVDDENIVSTYEGGTNLFWAERLGHKIGLNDLWVKQCGMAHTGSFKDLGMTVLVSMVKQMISDGKKIKAVACASTGDTSAALAAYCALAGIPAIVFLPKDKVSLTQLIQPITHGVLTLSLDTDFDGCMKLVQEVCLKNDIYLANSMNSLRIEGQKTISFEIVQQFNWEVPDFVIVPGGNLGNVSAVAKGFQMFHDLGLINKLPRLVCAQAERADPLYRSYKKGFKTFDSIQAKTTLASAIQIGDPVSYKKAVRELKYFNGVVEAVTETELMDWKAQIDKLGISICPNSAVAVAGAMKLNENGIIKETEDVVVILTAHGSKFSNASVEYHGDESNPSANHTHTVSPNLEELESLLNL